MQFSSYRSVISLRKGQIQKGGRNAQGKITVRHRGGGHKQAFRTINWDRTQSEGLIVGFEYDPNRSASLVKLYHNRINSVLGDYSYILAPVGAKIFQKVYIYDNKIDAKFILGGPIVVKAHTENLYHELTWTYFGVVEERTKTPWGLSSKFPQDLLGVSFIIVPPIEIHYTAQDQSSLSLQDKIKSGFNYLGYIYYYKKKESFKVLEPGDAAILSFFEPGDFIHAVESTPGQGSLFSRSAGSFCQVISKVQEVEKENYFNSKSDSKKYVTVRLPSGSNRHIDSRSKATFGVVSVNEFHSKNLEKAGRSRWLGFRPSVRGVAINPVDHPHGGGQGKTSGGRPSVTFKSWPTKGQPTRNKKRRNPFILSPRTK